MKRLPFHPAMFLAAALLASGCKVISFKKKHDDAKPDGSAQPGEAAAEAPKKGGKKDEPKVEAVPAAVDPQEFKGVSKAEVAFILACRALGDATGPVVAGRDGWTFPTAELRGIGAHSTAESKRHRALVDTISSYGERCRQAGIEFVLVPVPPKAVVYPDFLPADKALANKRCDSYLQNLYKELSKSGVKVLDVTDDLRADRTAKSGAMWPRAASVWSPRATQRAADAILKILKKDAWMKTLDRDKGIVPEEAGFPIRGETLPVRLVGLKDGRALKPLPSTKTQAPIVLVCDAQGLAWHDPGVPEGFKSPRLKGGLPDQLALAFGGVPIDVRGDASLAWQTAPGRLAPEKAKGVNAVVWCLSAANFLVDPSAMPKPPLRPGAVHGPTGAQPNVVPVVPELPGKSTPGLHLTEPKLEPRQ